MSDRKENYYEEPPAVELTISKAKILAILLLFLISTVVGILTQQTILLKTLLYAGMYFWWVIYFLGVVRLIVPEWISDMERDRNAWVVKVLILIVVVGILSILTYIAGIQY